MAERHTRSVEVAVVRKDRYEFKSRRGYMRWKRKKKEKPGCKEGKHKKCHRRHASLRTVRHCRICGKEY